jgi:hypothetical protein
MASLPKQSPHVKVLSQYDPEGLVEYSVVYTDRSLNHMSQTSKE